MLTDEQWKLFVESLRTYVYIMQDRTKPNRQKIGVSRNPRQRAYQLKTNLIHSIECRIDTVYGWEKLLHGCLDDFRLEREWFDLSSTGRGRDCLKILMSANNEQDLHEVYVYIRNRIKEV